MKPTHASVKSLRLALARKRFRPARPILLYGLSALLLVPMGVCARPTTTNANGKDHASQPLRTKAASAVTKPVTTATADKASPASAGKVPLVSLTITPREVVMPVGGTREFRLVDQNANKIVSATWMVSDFSVAELISLDPPSIAAVGPGEVTVTAMRGSQTVKAKVTVLRSSKPSTTPNQ